MKALILILSLLISGCAGTPIDMKLNPVAVSQMNELYDPYIEKSFCVSKIGIHNILAGGMFSVSMPLCNKDDIVMHTHPFYCESEANFIDHAAWKEYRERYGNTFFGVMAGKDKFYIYNP